MARARDDKGRETVLLIWEAMVCASMQHGTSTAARLPLLASLLRGASWSLGETPLLVQKLHKGVIRDEELYRMKKQQLMAGQLSPAAPAQVAAPR